MRGDGGLDVVDVGGVGRCVADGRLFTGHVLRPTAAVAEEDGISGRAAGRPRREEPVQHVLVGPPA